MNPALLRHVLQRSIVPLHDFVMACLSLPLAIGLRVGGDGLSVYTPITVVYSPICGVIVTVIFALSGAYRQVARYTSFRDVGALLKAIAVAAAAIAVLLLLPGIDPGVPRSVPLIQALCLVVLLIGPRCLRRAVHEAASGRRPAATDRPLNLPIVLVGGGDNATLLIRALGRKRRAPFTVVGIVELAHGTVGRNVLGVPVLGTLDDLQDVLRGLAAAGRRPARVVLTERVAVDVLVAIKRRADAEGVAIARLPDLTRFREATDDALFELQPVAFGDLLARPQIALDQGRIDALIDGRRVLVTGAGGSIGAELCRQIARRRPAELMLLDLSEYNLYAIDLELGTRFPAIPRTSLLQDVRDGDRIRATFARLRPDLVFHTAALKHVPLVEMNPVEGFRTNVFGTRNVAVAARDAGALAFVQVSTDKAVNPTNVMGATKRLAERVCQAFDLAAAGDGRHRTRFITVRFGNVFGSSGSVIPLFQKQLQQGGPITVTHPRITRFFMSIDEAAGLVLHASAHALGGQAERGHVLVLDMGEPVRILDIAEQIVRLAGLEPYRDVPIRFVGLRPGEKLFEELFDDGEASLPSGAPGVLAARSRTITLAEIDQALVQLRVACDRGDARAVIAGLARHVPGYAPRGVADSAADSFIAARGSRSPRPAASPFAPVRAASATVASDGAAS